MTICSAGNLNLHFHIFVLDGVLPLVRNLINHYKAGDLVGIADYPHVTRALDTFLARPAVQRGLEILAPR